MSRVLALVAGIALCPSLAQAQIGGTIFDGSGGPLLADTVYEVTSSLTVPSGETLTIQEGAVLKFSDPHQMTVNGTLLSNGTASKPVRFTSIENDAFGGDTGGDGFTEGGAGDWRGLIFNNASDASVLTETRISFAGALNRPGIDLNSATITIVDSQVSSCAASALDLNGSSTGATVSDSNFSGNVGSNPVIVGVPINAIDGFSNITGGNNPGGDYIQLSTGTLTADLTVTPDNLLNGALVPLVMITVPSGLTLTLDPGVVVKPELATFQLTVNGTLIADGTPADKVVFTSFADDTWAGDTNGDTTSSGAPGDWRGLVFNNASDASVLDNCVIAYGGDLNRPLIDLNLADISLTDSTLSDGAAGALDLSSNTLGATISGCTFADCLGAQPVVNGVSVNAIPGFSGNAATGCPGGNHMRITAGTVGADLTIGPDNLLNGVLVPVTPVTVQSLATLTLLPGVVVKPGLSSIQVTVNGTLHADGTQAQPIVFTSFLDDDFAGDTNVDGPSNGAAGDWRGIVLNDGADDSVLNNCVIAYGGDLNRPLVELLQADAEITNCVLRDGQSQALDLSSFTKNAVIAGCTFEDNGGISPVVDGVLLEALPGFLSNTASGNAGGDYALVTVNSPTVDVAIGPENLLSEVLIMQGSMTVPSGVTVTLRQGVVVKSRQPSAQWTVNGDLNLLGTAYHPVVFTSFADDAFAGDTNGDLGATAPAPDDWRGLIYNSALSSTVENVLVRYGGQINFAGLECNSENVFLRAVRAEHCGANGFELGDAGVAENLVAFDCGDNGIRLTDGDFNLLFATAAGNAGAGIRRDATYDGLTANSISWGNGTMEFEGFAAGELWSSNGDALLAGSNGNLFADPLFVNAPAGDLRLSDGSPCIDAADGVIGSGVFKDAREGSRLLDHDLVGGLLPDMGAHELGRWTMDATGEPELGETVTLTVTGPPGISIYILGFNDAATLIPGYGYLFTGPLPIVPLTAVNVGDPLAAPIGDNPDVIGTYLVLQAATLDLVSAPSGSATEVYRIIVRP